MIDSDLLERHVSVSSYRAVCPYHVCPNNWSEITRSTASAMNALEDHLTDRHNGVLPEQED